MTCSCHPAKEMVAARDGVITAAKESVNHLRDYNANIAQIRNADRKLMDSIDNLARVEANAP